MSNSLAKELAEFLRQDPEKPFPLIQAQKMTIKPSTIIKPKKGKNDWKLAALLPDTQIGYRVYEDGR